MKNSLSRKAIRTKNPEDRKQYNRVRNQVKKNLQRTCGKNMKMTYRKRQKLLRG
jgi:hypothetical protein